MANSPGLLGDMRPQQRGGSSGGGGKRGAFFVTFVITAALLVSTLGTTAKWLSAERRLTDTEEEIRLSRAEIAQLRKRLKSADQEARQVSKDLVQATGQLDLLKDDRRSLEEDKRVKEAAMLRARGEVHDLEAKMSAVQSQKDAVQNEAFKVSQASEDLKAQYRVLNETKVKVEGRLAEALRSIEALSGAVTKGHGEVGSGGSWTDAAEEGAGEGGPVDQLMAAKEVILQLIKGKTQHNKGRAEAADIREERSRQIVEQERTASVCSMDTPEEGAAEVAVKQTVKRWVFRNEGKEGRINYSHMSMISRLPPAAPWRWILVWQAAKEAEGSDDQHFECAYSDNAVKWTSPMHMPVREHGCVWGPVLMRTSRAVWMFYSESTTCLRPARGERPAKWSPGGHIKFVQSTDGLRWTKPVTIHEQWRNGGTPKVVANQVLLTQQGAMVLPYWQEVPRLDSSVVGCSIDGEAAAGALVSKDGGVTWKGSKKLRDVETWLIEGSVSYMRNGTLLQLFRTTTGYLYRSTSEDTGHTWSPAYPMHIPNPNSKVNLVRLHNGHLVLAYNHEGLTRGRSNLWVAISADDGDTWHQLAELETDRNPQAMYHYPTIIQDGCRILITYSVMYKPLVGFAAINTPGANSQLGGIRIAEVDLAGADFSDETLITMEMGNAAQSMLRETVAAGAGGGGGGGGGGAGGGGAANVRGR